MLEKMEHIHVYTIHFKKKNLKPNLALAGWVLSQLTS